MCPLKERTAREMRKIDSLYDLIEGKVESEHDVDRLVRQTPFQREMQYRRGEKSEQRVAAFLSNLVGSEYVRRSFHYSKDDMLGRDIIVELGIPHLEYVFIQVVSSQAGQRKYKEQLARYWSLCKEEVGLRLLSRNMMIINGNLPEKKIIESYQTQLDDIRKFHQRT